jgi:hypothetical protein
MTIGRWAATLIAVAVTMIASACGHAAKRTALRGPGEAVRVLQRMGYTPVPQVAPPPSGSDAEIVSVIKFKFDTRYGQPVAYYERGGLYVLVARGGAHTLQLRVPGVYWYRSGDTIVVGYPSRGSQRAQFQALVEAL